MLPPTLITTEDSITTISVVSPPSTDILVVEVRVSLLEDPTAPLATLVVALRMFISKYSAQAGVLYTMKNFRKDHRVLMMSCIAALTLGGNWIIHDSNSSNTSFPDFFEKIRNLGGVIN